MSAIKKKQKRKKRLSMLRCVAAFVLFAMYAFIVFYDELDFSEYYLKYMIAFSWLVYSASNFLQYRRLRRV